VARSASRGRLEEVERSSGMAWCLREVVCATLHRSGAAGRRRGRPLLLCQCRAARTRATSAGRLAHAGSCGAKRARM
jgi:hypothetical protein